MRTSVTLFVLCCCSLLGFGQKLQLKKAAPFTAVKWENDQPIVRFNTEWYTLEKLDSHTATALVAFCKQEYGRKWQKRFSEDLVEVLNEMGTPPDEKVQLILTVGGQQKTVLGTYSLENRQKVLNYNNAIQTIPVSQALEDIEEFRQLLEEQSSYLHLTGYNYKSALDALKTTVKHSTSDIDINVLTHELAKIMAEIGDRHSSVKNEGFVKETDSTYSLQLPFLLAPLNGKVVALKPTEKEGIYDYYYTDFPFVKTINTIAVIELIDSLVYKSKKAPKEAKFTRGVSELQQLGKLYFINNLKLPKQLELVFTNGKTTKTVWVQLQHKPLRYYSKPERNMVVKASEIEEGNFKSMSTLLTRNIGYIALPEMFSYDETAGLEQHIDSVFTAFQHTKALIIDLRFNPGGTRDLLQQFAGYIIPKAKSPWVANVAYLRTAEQGIYNSMSSRYLYTYNSDVFHALERKAIDTFTNHFTLQKEFDRTKFSNPHYMVLQSGKQPYTKPVYILVNERSFSAATVFTSAFKGLPNVTIVGITTDGSSGNSKRIHLKNSHIRVRISTMLSFQRNGKTLDGNGTTPYLYLPETEEQVLYGKDMQLESLLERIDNG